MVVWGVLLLLTAATVWSAQLHLGRVSLGVAMSIAATKVSLVGAYFMHLRYERSKLYLGFVIIGLAALGIFIGLTFTDIGVRY
jgi:cytochrome c oxidase subunit 4